MLEKFKIEFAKKLQPFLPEHCQFIVAVSGGVDSVVLVDLLHQLKVNIKIVHCNFKLRGEESLRDENFVIELSKKYNVECLVKKFETQEFAINKKFSIQLAARDLRYTWFKELQNQNTEIQTYILTAHHANDNIETVLMNFCRGTGLDGLTGIEYFNKEQKLIRPLLSFTKDEILQYANANEISFIEDSSNILNKYTRNSFRNEVLPSIQKHFPNVEENINANISRFSEVAEIYQTAIEELKNKLLKKVGDEIHIPILKLKKTKSLSTIIWEIFKEFNYNSHQISELIKLLDSSNGSMISNDSFRVLNNRGWLIISTKENKLEGNIVIEKNDSAIQFVEGKLKMENICLDKDFKISQDANIITVDASEIKYPLILRKWKQGDYFYPLGLDKKQKLSKFFINQKLSINQKEKVWILESNKKIIWVVGFRIDNRFKINNSTKQILKVTYTK